MTEQLVLELSDRWMPADPGLASKFEFYMGLGEAERIALDFLMMRIRFRKNNVEFAEARMGSGLKQTDLEALVQRCKEAGILEDAGYASRANEDFLIFVYPFIKDRRLYFNRSEYYMYFDTKHMEDAIALISTALSRAAGCEPDRMAEDKEYDISGDMAGLIWKAIGYEHYRDILPYFDRKELREICAVALTGIMSWCEDMTGLGDTYSEYSDLGLYRRAAAGDFDGLMSSGGNESDRMFAAASSLFLKEDDSRGAAEFFEKGLKVMRRRRKKCQRPDDPLWLTYYLCFTLTRLPAEYVPILEKIYSMETDYDMWGGLISRVCTSHTDQTGRTKPHSIMLNTTDCDDPTLTLGAVCMYLVDHEPDAQFISRLAERAEAMVAKGHCALAMEALYALSRWSAETPHQELYRTVRERIGFDPALSRIKKGDDWERVLDNLALLAAGKDPAGQGASQTRIGYIIRMGDLDVQPISQKRLARGGWSTGKKISLRILQKKSEPGMTEADLKIASHISLARDGWDSNLVLDPGALYEMIGHPGLYVDGISAEFVGGDPEIVIREADGEFFIKAGAWKKKGNITITKDGPGRYKIAKLPEGLSKAVDILIEKPVRVPLDAAEKLAGLAETLSAVATVHSDVGGGDKNARTVDADPRVRVLMTPSPYGITAEILSKPFNDMPPYFSPGEGGRTVICTKDGERLRAVRDLETEDLNRNTIVDGIQAVCSAEPLGDNAFSFRDPSDALELLDLLRVRGDIVAAEWPEGAKLKLRTSVGYEKMTLSMGSGEDWFRIDGDVVIDEDKVISMKELLAMNASGSGRFIEIGDGEFIALSKQLKKQLDQLCAVADTRDGIRVNRFAMASVGDFMDSVDSLRCDPEWTALREQMNDPDPDDSIPEGLAADLRPYQAEGFRWMSKLASWDSGACLADDMGLGKTVQAICMLLKRSGNGPGLVVAPVSVIPNWVSEIEKFAPGLNPVTVPADGRAELVSSLKAGDVLVSSYSMLQSEEEIFSGKEWGTAVLDEAHNIKNFATKTAKAASSLKAGFRLALTGTPIQNRTSELWTIFNFMNPGMMGALSEFTRRFPPGDEGSRQLRKLISPFILRRTKSSVLDDLPPKTEITLKVEMSPEEVAFYEAVRQRAVEAVENAESIGQNTNIQILAEITRLRQASCNPKLIDPNSKISSSKMAAFSNLVTELAETGHRALVFSQFVRHLALAKETLDANGIGYLYLDGSTPVKERERLVKEFQSGTAKMFLVSLKAGGLGLNLTMADFVIHLDPWWNPAVEDQASDRAHRIGQSKPVTVYRLVSKNTIEEKIITLHTTKRDLADDLLKGSDRVAKLSAKELMDLLRGA